VQFFLRQRAFRSQKSEKLGSLHLSITCVC
jgi:hypothetical protein